MYIELVEVSYKIACDKCGRVFMDGWNEKPRVFCTQEDANRDALYTNRAVKNGRHICPNCVRRLLDKELFA